MFIFNSETKCLQTQITYTPSSDLSHNAHEGQTLKSNNLLLEWDCGSRKWTFWMQSFKQIGSWRIPAYLGSAWEPKEMLHLGMAQWYTSFLGLSEEKEKEIEFQTVK